MRYSMLAGGAVMLTVAACSAGRAESARPEIGRTFAVGAFNKIEVAGPFAVDVSTGRQPSVAARGPSTIVEKMEVVVEDGTLKIRPERRRGMLNGRSASTRGIVRVAVGVPMLRAAEVAGSGDMTVDRVAAESFSASVAGSGGLRLPQVQVGSLRLEVAGSGDATAAGRATAAHYEIAGSGNIQAGQVATDQARAEIAGSGNIEANAHSAARVEIAGSGNVRVTGGGRCTVSKAGSGTVQCS
jgi:hypothetical protein